MRIENVNVDWFEVNSTHIFDINVLEQIYQEKLNIQQLNIQEKVLECDFYNFDNYCIADKLKDFLNKCDLKVCKQATSYYSLQLKVSDFFTIYLQTEFSKLNNNSSKNIKIIASSILNQYFDFSEIKEMTLALLDMFNADMNNLNFARIDYCIDTIISYEEFESLKEEEAYNLRTKRDVNISHFYSGKNFTGIAFKFTNSKFFRIYDKLQEVIEAEVYSHKENLYFKKYLNVDTTLVLRDDYNAVLNRQYREELRKTDELTAKHLEKKNIIYTNYEILNKLYRMMYQENRVVRFEYELKKDALKRLDMDYLELESIKYLVIENLISATPVSYDYFNAKANMEYYKARTEKEIYEKIKSKGYVFNNAVFNYIFKNDEVELESADLIFTTKYLVEFTAERLKKSFKRIKSSVKNHFIRLEAVRDLVPDLSNFITYFNEIKSDVLNFDLKQDLNLIGNEIFVNSEDSPVFQELHRKNFKIEKVDFSDLNLSRDFYIDCRNDYTVSYQI